MERNTPLPAVRQLFVIGSGERGQLGAGKHVNAALNPVRVDVAPPKKVYAGHNHVFALLDNGELYSWGNNENGQVGIGHRDHVYFPTRVPGFEGHTIDFVSPGPLQTFVVTTNNRTQKQAIWHCGMAYPDPNTHELFTAHTSMFRKTKKKKYLLKTRIRKIIPSGDFCLFISEDHKIYSFGTNGEHGALGHSAGDDSMSSQISSLAGPVKVPLLEEIDFEDATVGWGHTVALSKDGDVISWGNNEHGQLGLGSTEKFIHEPRPIDFFGNINVKQVASGETHSLAVDDKGQVYVWGSHAEGKLGLGDNVKHDLNSPQIIPFFKGIKVIQVTAGTDHSAAITEDGRVYLWGFGQHGQMGPNKKNYFTPLPASQPSFFSPFMDQDEEFRKTLQSEIPADTPFRINGKEVHDAEYFDRMYDHQFHDVGCGMDVTYFTLQSTLRSTPKKDEDFDLSEIGKNDYNRFKQMKQAIDEKVSQLAPDQKSKFERMSKDPKVMEQLRRLQKDPNVMKHLDQLKKSPDMRRQMEEMEKNPDFLRKSIEKMGGIDAIKHSANERKGPREEN